MKKADCFLYTLTAFFIHFTTATWAQVHESEYGRVWNLTSELRCLTCEGQSVRDSNSDFSNEVRQFIYDCIKNELSNDEIKSALLKKYSADIFFEPPLQKNTYILWYAPFILFFLLIFFVIKRQISIAKRN